MQKFEITEKRIYQLLKHPYQTDKSITDDLHAAYNEFVEELFGYLKRNR